MQTELQNGLPSRTSLLVAAARAFGSRDPDEGVRNPDLLADRLIGPEERALISEHPISQGLEQDYAEASQNPAIAMLVGMMIVRTRFIDEALKRAVERGATQIVVLGAGFDTRAYRFQHLLKDCHVIEADSVATQEYKKQRVKAALGEVPLHVTYARVDFANDDISQVLKAAGLREGTRTFYIWEGVSMYLPELSAREILRMVASHSAPGSSIVLDYTSSLGLQAFKAFPQGPVGMAAGWGEPWIFGVPDANGNGFFRELGFDPGVPLSLTSPEAIKQYAVRQDGTTYAARVFEKMQAEAQARMQAGTAPSLPPGAVEFQKAVAAAGGVYWLAELTVPSYPR
jgi:methyltransferase (TIGR00027 family)